MHGWAFDNHLCSMKKMILNDRTGRRVACIFVLLFSLMCIAHIQLVYL